MPLTILNHPKTTKPAADTLVFGLFAKEPVEKHPFYTLLAPEQKQYLRTFLRKGFTNEKDEVDFVVLPSGKPTAFLVGLGKRADWTDRRYRLFLRRLVSLAASQKVTSLAVALHTLQYDAVTEQELARTATENILLAEYRFGKFQKQKPKGRKLQRAVLVTATPTGMAAALRTGKIVGTYANLCRDFSNTPANHLTPQQFAEHARELAKKTGCVFRVLDRSAMEKERMGAILGVARGSAEEPRFVIMEYRGGPRRQAPLVFVGKGVTFDSGGINLKPAQFMADMHMDMSGGAAAVCATAAIAECKLPINVVALVPAVENMPSGSGYRPGDVLTSRAGTTIEIGDTDAEGRVILADALDYAKQYKPQLIVDLATLTGAAVVALGMRFIGLFTPDERLAAEIRSLGDISGDHVWPLPMTEEYDQEIKGTFGDLSNIGKVRYGGAIHGAMFLKHFVGSLPWVHLDIAPTMVSTDGQFLAKGATGTGVRLLVRLAEQRSRIKGQ